MTRWVTACLGAALLLAASPAPSAQAHVELVASAPAEGDRVPLSLDRVVLTFGTDLLAAGAVISVRDPRGAEVPVGATGTLGETASASVALATPGRHTIDYRVVGQDGHVLVGSLRFTVVAGNPPDSPATTVSREALPGAAATAAGPGSVLWVLLAAFVLGVLSLHRVAASLRRRTGTDDPARTDVGEPGVPTTRSTSP